MPNLSDLEVNKFWESYDRKTIYRILLNIENAEKWCIDDDPEVASLIEYLGNCIENKGISELKDYQLIISVLANIKAGKAMRLLQFFETQQRGYAGKLLKHSESSAKRDSPSYNPVSELLLERNYVFERNQLLARIFSPSRVNLVRKSVESVYE